MADYDEIVDIGQLQVRDDDGSFAGGIDVTHRPARPGEVCLTLVVPAGDVSFHQRNGVASVAIVLDEAEAAHVSTLLLRGRMA